MSFETMSIERHLLKLLLTDIMVTRPFILNVKEIWFFGYRKIIFKMALEMFRGSGTILTQDLFEAEIDKLYPGTTKKEMREKLVTEWTLIKQCDVQEEVKALIEKLEEKECIGSVSLICEETLGRIQKGDIKGAVHLLKKESIQLNIESQTDQPMVQVTEVKDIDQRIHDQKANPAKYGGIKTGFQTFDKLTGGLFPAEMTLIAALSGVGKSTILKQIGYNIVIGNQTAKNPYDRYPGKNVLHITNEEHRDQVRLKYHALFSNIDYFRFKNATIDPAGLKQWKAIMKELERDCYGRLFIKDIGQHSTVAEIHRAYAELEQIGFKIHVIILDYMDHMSPMQKAFSENDEQAKVAKDCKGMCVEFNLPLVTATQAATSVAKKEEKGHRFGRQDVYGSKRRVHASNTFIGIMQKRFDDTQIANKDGSGGDREDIDACDRLLLAEVCKNRDNRNFVFKIRHCVKTGRVVQEDWKGDDDTGKTGPISADKVKQELEKAYEEGSLKITDEEKSVKKPDEEKQSEEVQKRPKTVDQPPPEEKPSEKPEELNKTPSNGSETTSKGLFNLVKSIRDKRKKKEE